MSWKAQGRSDATIAPWVPKPAAKGLVSCSAFLLGPAYMDILMAAKALSLFAPCRDRQSYCSVFSSYRSRAPRTRSSCPFSQWELSMISIAGSARRTHGGCPFPVADMLGKLVADLGIPPARCQRQAPGKSPSPTSCLPLACRNYGHRLRLVWSTLWPGYRTNVIRLRAPAAHCHIRPSLGKVDWVGITKAMH